MAGILDKLGAFASSPTGRSWSDALLAAGAKGLQSTGARYALPRSSSQNYGDMLAAFQGSMQASEKRQSELETRRLQQERAKLQIEAAERAAKAEEEQRAGLAQFKGLLGSGPVPTGTQHMADEGYSPELEGMTYMQPGDRAKYGNDLRSAMFAAAPTLGLKSEYDIALAKSKLGTGPFRGTSLPAQSMNTLLSGDPSTQQYAAAYAHYSRPKTFQDPNTGLMTTVTPDMSPYRQPTFKGTGGAYGPRTSQKPYSTPKLSDAQNKAKGFYDRVVSAERDLALTDTEGASLKGRMAEGVPGGNYVQTPAYQRFEQARRNFINAVLRRESGAVINPDEFDNADRQYFPVPGDKPAVIEQKRRNRKDAIEGLKRSATPGYVEPKKKPQPKPKSAAGRRYKKMSKTEFLAVDVSKLSKAQRSAYEEELTRRGM